MNRAIICIVLALLVAYCLASTAQYSNSIAAVAVSSTTTLSSDEHEALEQNEEAEVLATTVPPPTNVAPTVRLINSNASAIPASAVPPNGYFLTNGVCATSCEWFYNPTSTSSSSLSANIQRYCYNCQRPYITYPALAGNTCHKMPDAIGVSISMATVQNLKARCAAIMEGRCTCSNANITDPAELGLIQLIYKMSTDALRSIIRVYEQKMKRFFTTTQEIIKQKQAFITQKKQELHQQVANYLRSKRLSGAALKAAIANNRYYRNEARKLETTLSTLKQSLSSYETQLKNIQARFIQKVETIKAGMFKSLNDQERVERLRGLDREFTELRVLDDEFAEEMDNLLLRVDCMVPNANNRYTPRQNRRIRDLRRRRSRRYRKRNSYGSSVPTNCKSLFKK